MKRIILASCASGLMPRIAQEYPQDKQERVKEKFLSPGFFYITPRMPVPAS